MDIFEEARLASLFQGARTGDPAAVSAQTALELATIGGARALKLDHLIGSLDPGKAADLSAFPLDFPCTVPAQDPVATAIYALSGTRASLVTVAGHHLVEEGELTMPIGTLCNRVTLLGEALAASGGSF
jgi:5-methylthioadenosine/S-adenosylhomocysteine deaminase